MKMSSQGDMIRKSTPFQSANDLDKRVTGARHCLFSPDKNISPQVFILERFQKRPAISLGHHRFVSPAL